MAKIFVYISHKNGVADDSALELVAAAKKIDAGADVTALVFGSGVDAVCGAVAASYKNVWKIDGAAVAYPNAEVIRAMLVKLLPSDAVVLMPHDTFGMDLGPGLSIKMNSPFAPDVVGIDGVDGSTLKMVRQEFGGQVSTHVACDIAAGAVITIRSGSFAADESKSAGGAVNAATSFDYTMYYADLPADRWLVGLEVIRDMIFGARFDPAEL
ncbi:MAG: insulinase family protein, partial [Thermodesulfobacteriota bacterium]